MLKPSIPASCIMLCTTRLVEVPIRVHMPPSIVTYDSGIRKYVAGSFTKFAHLFIIGAKMTTTGVLLRKADMNAMLGSILSCALKTFIFLTGNNFSVSLVSAPLWRMPSLTRKSMATVIMPLLLKPSNISFGLSIPVHKNMTRTVNKIIPGLILSAINAASIPTSETRTIIISCDIS